MQLGERLSHYRIVGKLGEGGMGVVYRAEDVRLGRQVALKVLAPHLAGNAVARRRFEDEARAASALDHPNICALYDVGETPDGGLFLALAYCEGETLSDRLAQGPIEPARALAIATQIADGLGEAHDKGIVHRDIKPANVMLRPDGLVKILDFGVARLARDAGITGPSDSLGSPAYMAPEQIQSARVGPSADVWAVGVVLFEMIAGRRPFEADGISATLYNIVNRSAPPLHELRPGLHPDVSRLVARALAKEPTVRHASARELAAELRTLAAGDADPTRTRAKPPASLSGPASDAGATQPPTASITQPPVPSPSQSPSLAVLPFSDLSAARDQDWFCEGLAEELITALSAVRGLRVASRASTLQFRDQDPRVIGQKLQVETLLTGGVRKAGNRLRITTQLIQVADGSVLTSSRYDSDLDDVFALQEEIARAAVEAVLARVGARVTAPRVRRPTENIEAYNLYLKGRHHLNRRTLSGFRAAIPLFEQAIEKDPDFAIAYAGLADVQYQIGLFNAAHPLDVMKRGKELCLKALEIDPDLAEARTTLAMFQAMYEWDWSNAEAELRRVLARDPGCSAARQALALYVLAPLGRFDQAVAELEAALAADPVSIPFNVSLGFVLHFARRSERAVAQLRSTLDIGSESQLTRIALSEALIDLGRTDEATDVLLASSGDQIESQPPMGWCHARSGRIEEARAILDGLVRPPPGTYVSPTFPAVLLIHLGELESALDFLELAVEERSPWLVWVGVRPVLDPLRGHPRFQRILERVGLADPGPAGPMSSAQR